MKKLILSMIALSFLLTTNAFSQGSEREQMEQPQVNQQPQETEGWQRSEVQTWRGADNVWYRREGEIILKSEDGQTWERTEDNRFQTMDGTWYRYENGELRRSSDGQTWEETEDWSDQDGRSFRFDQQGRLHSKGGTGMDDGTGTRRPEHRGGATDDAGRPQEMERE
jgi:Ni/Co efflux regulator RcnB